MKGKVLAFVGVLWLSLLLVGTIRGQVYSASAEDYSRPMNSNVNSTPVPPDPQKPAGGQTILDDFMVNNDDLYAGSQNNPSIARAISGGNFIICWEDNREGGSDIYAQRCSSSGTALGSNFRVNDAVGTASQVSPAVAMDLNGNFVITWQDNRNGNKDIYAQRYDTAGIALGPNFRVNNDAGTINHFNPAIAAWVGGFVITWEDKRDAYQNIYAQRYNSSGSPTGSNYKVNWHTIGLAHQYIPAVAANLAGEYVITWKEWRNSGTFGIYAQKYSLNGDAVGSNFKVNDVTVLGGYNGLAIGMNGTNNTSDFVITWQNLNNSDWNIYAQRYDPSGVAVGTNFKVNDDVGTTRQEDPAIVMDLFGNSVITWYDRRNGGRDVYAQRYNPSGVASGSNFKVNDVVTFDPYNDSPYPAISATGNGDFVITWRDGRSGKWDIYAQRFDVSGGALASNFRVDNDALSSAAQEFPVIGVSRDGSIVIAWQDNRNGNSDIYARRYKLGYYPSSNFRVNDYTPVEHLYPKIAVDKDFNFVIVWEDYRNGCPWIYAQRYNSSGTLLGSNFPITSFVSCATMQYFPDIAMDSVGNFVVTWSDTRNGSKDVYARRFNSSGTALGSEFKVNDAGPQTSGYSSVSMDGTGNFVIAWSDTRNGPLGNIDIYAQRYNSSGTALGANFQVSSPSPVWERDPDIASDLSGNFIIAWTDYTCGGAANIYAQRYNSSGTALGINFQVDDNVLCNQYAQKIAVDWYGNFVIAWSDFRDGNFADVYAQKYSSAGVAEGANFMVNDAGNAESNQYYPAAAGFGIESYYFTWMDTRRGNYDIFATGKYTPYSLTFRAYSPVNLIITDPVGDSIGVSFNTIQNGSSYDTSNDSVFIPNPKVGDYRIKVVKDPLDLSGDPDYSLTARLDETAENLLATNVPVPGTGESHTYFITNSGFVSGCLAKPGDANASGTHTLGDAIAIVNYIFNKPGCTPIPSCWLSSLLCRGDWDGSTTVSLSDVIRAVNFIFSKPGGPWNALASGVCCL
jgi:hypothetical protein